MDEAEQAKMNQGRERTWSFDAISYHSEEKLRAMKTLKTKFVRTKNIKKPPIVPCPIDDDRPAEPPMIIDLMLNILDISEFNAEEFTAKINIEMVYFWVDPRLVNKTQEHLNWSETWCPRPSICNCGELDAEEPDCVIQNSSTGLCKATCTLRGYIKNHMDLNDFPCDGDVVELRFDFQKQGLPAEQAIIRFAQASSRIVAGVKDVLCLDLEFSALTAWDMLGFGAYLRKAQYKQAWSQFVLCVFVRRFPMFYLVKVALLMVLSSTMSFGVYQIEDIGDRMSYLVTVFIANGALLFVSSGSMPKTPYLTALDKVVLAGFLQVFIVFVHNFLYSAGYFDEAQMMSLGGGKCRKIAFEAICIAGVYGIVTISLLVGPLTRYRKMAQETECNDRINIFAGSLNKCLDSGIFLKKSEIGDIYEYRA